MIDEMNSHACLQFRSYTVPRQDNEAFCDPPLNKAWDVADANRKLIDSFDIKIGGIEFRALRRSLQLEIIKLAQQWTCSYAASNLATRATFDNANAAAERFVNSMSAIDSDTTAFDRPFLFVGGHQPEIFHTGVWFKNAVLSRLAKCDGVSINLLIDHDLAKHHSLSIPTLTDSGQLIVRNVAFAELKANLPWEQLAANQFELLDDFEAQVEQLDDDALQQPPMLKEFWEQVEQAVAAGRSLGQAIAIARHTIELTHGWQTLDLPLSQVCKTWQFGCFVNEIISRGEQVVNAYNDARRVYREYHGLRNEVHPVPPLVIENNADTQWVETPFWIYSDASPTRAALFIKRCKGRNYLTNKDDIEIKMRDKGSLLLNEPLWQETLKAGIKIRPRALMITTFLRLFAADLFVHGIGGGKYDQVTDLLISKLWGIEPPVYMVATASLFLPLSISAVPQSESPDAVRQVLRDVEFNPNRYLNAQQKAAPEIHRLLVRRAKLLQDIPARGAKKAWHEELRQVNTAMAGELLPFVDDLRLRYEAALQAERQNKLLRSREYAFAMFDADYATDHLEQLTHVRCPSESIS